MSVEIPEGMEVSVHTFGSQELGLRRGVLGVDQTSWVDLDLVHVDALGTDRHEHLVAVTGGVCAVGGGEVVCVRPPLLQQRRLCEISGVATGRKHDGTAQRCLLAVEEICDTSGAVALHVDLLHVRLLDELDALRLLLGELLESLHQRVCDGHAGELGIVAAVGSRLRVATAIRQLEIPNKREM